jgi:hypothetical protein
VIRVRAVHVGPLSLPADKADAGEGGVGLESGGLDVDGKRAEGGGFSEGGGISEGAASASVLAREIGRSSRRDRRAKYVRRACFFLV